MPRGGARQGKPGKAYPQRTDLSAVKPPMMAATGQPYGQAKAQMDAQRAVPVAPPPAQPPVAAKPFVRPTERPQEPVTAGVSLGPGPGPEALPILPREDEVVDAERWRAYLPALEYAATQPGSSQATRNFLRKIRATLRTDL